MDEWREYCTCSKLMKRAKGRGRLMEAYVRATGWLKFMCLLCGMWLVYGLGWATNCRRPERLMQHQFAVLSV